MAENKQLSKNRNEQNENEQSLPAEVAEVLQTVAPDARKKIEYFMHSQISLISRMSPETQVMKQVTSDHITTMLQTQENAMQNTFKENHEKRISGLIAGGLLAGFLVFIIVFLKDTPDIMEKIIYAAGGLLAGAVGGYGFGRAKRED